MAIPTRQYRFAVVLLLLYIAATIFNLYYVNYEHLEVVVIQQIVRNQDAYTNYFLNRQHMLDRIGTESILHDMKRCSLRMGVLPTRLDENYELMRAIAKNASLLLLSLRKILPEGEELIEYKNPCWRTPFMFVNGSINLEDPLKKLSLEEMVQLSQNRTQWVKNSTECVKEDECLHCLPYFFLAGFPKSGTTSLHYVLSQHNQVVPPLDKEPQWWSRTPLVNMTEDYLNTRALLYLLYFEEAAARIVNSSSTITYDASQTLWTDSPFQKLTQYVDYCANAIVVSRMLPNLKFIIAMRNPADALYSAYFDFHGNYGSWPPSMKKNASLFFHNESKASIERFEECLFTDRSEYECDVEANTWGEMNTRLSGRIYVREVLKWMQFYPIGNFLFLKTEEFTKDPVGTMNRVTTFLDLEPVSNETAKALFSVQKNSRSKSIAKKYKDMLPKTKTLLADFYAPFNKQLAQLLNDTHYMW